MSQTDLNVANASGAAVRTDINAHLDALASQSSGASEPSTKFPNQWWLDTSTNILKQRDNANTAWVNVASKAGTNWVPYRNGTLLDTMAIQDASAVAITGGSIAGIGISVLSTEQATTSGTTIDFTGIPDWVKKITVEFIGVSTDGTDGLIVQIGDAGGIEATGYLGAATDMSGGSVATDARTTGFGLDRNTVLTGVMHGTITLTLENAATFTWVGTGIGSRSDIASNSIAAGSKSLSDTLTQLRITTVAGSTFDVGAVNIIYE